MPDFQLLLTLGVFVVVMILLMLELFAPEVVMVAGLLVLTVCGVITEADALSGFANPSVITIAALYVVGAGLQATGAMETISRFMIGRPTAQTSLFRMLVPVSVLSAFMNNTPLVAFFMPIFIQIAKRLRVSPSRFLIPLSYAAILGGVCTLVGTSTNLVVDAKLQKLPGQRPMGMFELTPVGLPIAIVGLVFLTTVGRRLLPDRTDLLDQFESDPREYTVEMVVHVGCELINKTVRQAGLRELPGLYLYRIERGATTISPVTPNDTLLLNDLLCFSGIASTVVDLQKIRGLVPIDHRPDEAAAPVPADPSASVVTRTLSLDSFEGLPAEAPVPAPRRGRQLCEVVISATSPLLGTTIREANFRSRYNASVLAVHRSGEKLDEKIGRIVLRSGDTLLIDADDDFVKRWRHSPDFILVSGVDDSAPIDHERAWIALGIFGMVVLGMSFGSYVGLSPVVVTLVGAVLTVLTGCVRHDQGHRSIELTVILLVGAALGISTGLEKSGAAQALASTILQASRDADPRIALALIYLLTVVMSEFLNNNACAAMMVSIAYAAAQEMGVDPRPFFIAVAVGSSCAFATPIGYATNLMVLNPGGYKFTDYLRVGLPLNVICMIVACILIPLIWPLQPPLPLPAP